VYQHFWVWVWVECGFTQMFEYLGYGLDVETQHFGYPTPNPYLLPNNSDNQKKNKNPNSNQINYYASQIFHPIFHVNSI
jgi:hypothetical protein